jgi:hypothetical protein
LGFYHPFHFLWGTQFHTELLAFVQFKLKMTVSVLGFYAQRNPIVLAG